MIEVQSAIQFLTTEGPARASPATKYDFYFTTEGTENTEYQRLDGGAIKLHSRIHADRILTAIPSVFSVVQSAICVLTLRSRSGLSEPARIVAFGQTTTA